MNFDPIDLIEGLPGFDKGAFYVEEYDPKPHTIKHLDEKYKKQIKDWEAKKDDQYQK